VRVLLRPSGALAVVRLVALPLFLLAERAVDHPAARTGPFPWLLAAAALYALAALAAELTERRFLSAGAQAGIDVVLVAALVETSGGPFSSLRYAFFLLPVGAALLLRPRTTALASLAAVAIYAVIAATYPDPEDVRRDAIGFEFTQGLFLLWMGVAATLLAAILTRRAEQVATLAAQRRRLVAQTLDAEDAARRRLAEALHDDALQNLLAARQLLGHGDAELVAAGLDAGVRQIREAVFDLHPYLLDHAGLRAALQAIADQVAQRGGPAVTVTVDPGAQGVHDQLVFSLARELLANAVRHAGATRIEIRAGRTADAVELEVADDGVGIDPARVRAAPLRGHIGLASCRERTEAIGGSFAVGRGPGGRGTVVVVSLPAPARGPG
jgi:two-component system NarL family sensor kinase